MALAAAEALEALSAARFVPVVRAESPEAALQAAHALVAGGCPVVEVTLTVPGALEVIRALAAEGIPVGAGTVLDAAAVEAACAAGADFLVAPCTDAGALAAAQALDRLMIPGALTPNEVMAAMRLGAPVVKIFPVESVGGPRYLKLLRDPVPEARFFPTGGVTIENAAQFLANGAVAVGVGTALADPRAIARGDWATLSANARKWCEALQPPQTFTASS